MLISQATRVLIVVTLAANTATVGNASEMTDACSRHLEKDPAIDCYKTLIAGMKENRTWCQSFGLREASDLQASIGRSKDRIAAAWTTQLKQETEEFGRQAEAHVTDMFATQNAGLKAKIAARWRQFEFEFRQKRAENGAKRSLQNLYNDFNELEKAAGKLECP